MRVLQSYRRERGESLPELHGHGVRNAQVPQSPVQTAPTGRVEKARDTANIKTDRQTGLTF